MKQAISRSAFFGLIVTVLVIGGITTRNALRWVDKPFAGFLVNERMVVGNIGQYHWPGIRAGLKWPDRILAADGRPVGSMDDLDAVVTEGGLGQSIVYAVDRGGRRIEITAMTTRFTWLDWLMTFGITSVSGLLYLLIGALVFLLKPHTRVSWVFVLACGLVGTFEITSFDIQSTHAGFVRLYLLVSALFPAAFVHLGLIFPERLPFVESHPVLAMAPYVVSAALVVPLQILYPRPEFVQVYVWVRLYAILGGATVLASTIHAYLTSSSPLAKQRARVIGIGALLGCPIPAAAYYVSLFGGDWLGVSIQNNFLALPIMLFPAAVAYAIARHNLFDVDVYIKRAGGYAVMTALVAVGYVMIQMLTRRMILEPIFGEYSDRAYPVLFALLVVWLFNPVLRQVQGLVDRVWFRAESDYKRTVTDVSSALRSMLDRREIMRKVVQTVADGMFLDRAGMVLFETGRRPSDWTFLREGPGRIRIVEDGGVALMENDPLIDLVYNARRLVTRYALEEDSRYASVKAVCLRRYADLGLSMVIPLIYRGDVTGMIALGTRKSGRFYSRGEVELLNTLADQAAVAVQNARSHERVVRYAEELAAGLRRIEMLESIRANLAKFVPRSVQEAIERSPEAPSLDKREQDLSVLFADITGYSRLATTMDLDRVNRLVERYFGAFLDEIVKVGGEINETAGDGLMVIFQDPDGHRHARAAVMSAIGIQRRTAEINAESNREGDPIVMHVGVNSGIASVGATKIEGMTGSRWTYTASGTTTNVAARLSALSKGGAVIVSEETWRRLGGEFQGTDLGHQRLKNVSGAVGAYRLNVWATEEGTAFSRWGEESERRG